jgi:hypothetical protein
MDEIAIWYASEQTGGWEVCPTFFIDERRSNGTSGRFSAPGSGIRPRAGLSKNDSHQKRNTYTDPDPEYPYPPWEPTLTPYPYP